MNLSLIHIYCTTMYQQLFDEGVSIECLAAVDEDFPAAEAFRAAG